MLICIRVSICTFAVSKSMDSGLPPSAYNEALEASQPPYELKGLPPSEVTIAETLKEKGYSVYCPTEFEGD